MAVSLKPIFRAAKYAWLYKKAREKAREKSAASAVIPTRTPPTAFIIGCGRSGTTILGQLLSTHPTIRYLFEPYHLWAALDERSDVLNLYHNGAAQLMMSANESSDSARNTFARLFWPVDDSQMLIEKTPLNVYRIGYLQALMPQAKFVHIVRDGVDVAHSISRLATGSPYKIAGKPELNQWWGVAGQKWARLKREGAAAGYWASDVDGLKTETQKGAYEWLTSLAEMDRQRTALGLQLHEMVYEQFIYAPEKALTQLCNFLGLSAPTDWLESSAREIRLQTPTPKTVDLPPAVAQAFNAYQLRYGFSQRASIIGALAKPVPR
ncbi:MAG: sulfotransferase [Cyanobacteria bacterium J06598_3]